MKIGVPKETKNNEGRVGLTPAGARSLVDRGHTVQVEHDAGEGSGFSDQEYTEAGAEIVSAENAWDADLVIKVKEPLEREYTYLREQIVFTFFHLPGAPEDLTETLLASNTTAIAYETIEDDEGRLPLLAPMSAVAGNLAVTMGSYYLAKFNGGRGTQLGSVLGVPHGKVVIVGDGTVGCHAASTADGMGAQVVLLGRKTPDELRIREQFTDRLRFVASAPETVAEHTRDADLVIGAVLIRGSKAPCVVTEPMVQQMQPGSVIVDVSIDQGGCVETSRPTSHSDPIFIEHGVIHYCVANMPGAYPKTSTIALSRATLPYILKLAEKGLEALREDGGFRKGLNIYQGRITSRPVAEALGLPERFGEFTEILHG